MHTFSRYLTLMALSAMSCADQTPGGADPGDVGSGTLDKGADLTLNRDKRTCANPSWEQITPGPGRSLPDIQGIGSDTLFGLDSRAKILRGDGNGWTEETMPWAQSSNWRCLGTLWGSDLKNLYAVGREIAPGPPVDHGMPLDASMPPHTASSQRALLIRREASGWKEVQVPHMAGLASIWGFDAKNIFMVGRGSPATGGLIQMVRFDGATFKTQPLGAGVMINAIWGTSPNNVYAVGDKGAVYHHDGSYWKAAPSPGDRDLLAIWGTGPNNIFAVGNGIHHFDGKTWTVHLGSTIKELTSVWGSGPNNVFVAGYGGIIKHYDGHEWSSMNIAKDQHIWTIWGRDKDTAYISGGTNDHFSGYLLKLKCG